MNVKLFNEFALGAIIKINYFFIFRNVKGSLVLNVIPNVNLEIGSQRTVAKHSCINANHSSIQQFHIKFCCLIKKNWTI